MKAQPPKKLNYAKGRSHDRRLEVLFIPPTPPRDLWFAHEAGAAVPPVLDEVLGHPVYFIITTTAEEGDPKMLPRMTIGCDRVLIHYPTVGAEGELFPLVVPVIEGHPRQAVGLVELEDHILPLRLECHGRGHDSYKGAVCLSLDQRTHAGHVLRDSSSGVEGEPLALELEIIRLALGDVSLTLQMLDPQVAYDGLRMGLIGRSS